MNELASAEDVLYCSATSLLQYVVFLLNNISNLCTIQISRLKLFVNYSHTQPRDKVIDIRGLCVDYRAFCYHVQSHYVMLLL